MSDKINQHRRHFLGVAAGTVATAQLVMNGSSEAQSSKARTADTRSIKPGANTSFSSLKRIDAGLLNFGYAEAGPGFDWGARTATITMEGDANGAPHPKPSAYANKFSGRYAHGPSGAASATSASGSPTGLCRSRRRRR